MLNLLKLLIMLKRLIYRKDYLQFYINMGQKRNLGDMQTSMQIQKEALLLLTWLSLLFAQ